MPEDARSRSRLVVVAVVLALGGWALLRWLADDAPPPASDGFALEADSEVAVPPPPPPEVAAPGPGARALPNPPRPRGTDWEDRLALGTWLAQVRTCVEDGGVPLALQRRACAWAWLGLLDLERGSDVWWTRFQEEPRPSAEELQAMLVQATEPSLAREAFTLHCAQPGAQGPVRLWTLAGGNFPAARIAEAEALLRRLDRLASHVAREGYDVLATPGMGREVFPHLDLPPGVIGFFHRFDEVAVIGTGHGERDLQRLLNHELIHAWARDPLERWRHRFVTEGMAEYLMWLRPGDPTLRVPVEFLRDNFAWVLRFVDLLDAYGLDIRTVPMRRLVELPGLAFYSLGWFLYGTSQACYAYLPEGVLERALETRDERGLADALAAIRWEDLLRWMREVVGDQGDPAKARLTGEIDGMCFSRGGRVHRPLPLGMLLRSLFRRPPTGAVWAFVWAQRGDPGLDSDERVAEVLQRIAARGDGPSDLVVELTSALEQTLDAERARAAPWLAAGEAPAARGDALARDLRRWLEGPPRTAGARVAGAREQTTSVVRLDVAPGARLDLPELATYLRALPDEPDVPLVLVLGGADADHRGRLLEAVREGAGPAAPPATPEAGGLVSQWALDALSERPWRRRTVLVVDVGDGTGDARPLAEALAVRTAGEGLVAWWHVGRVPPR